MILIKENRIVRGDLSERILRWEVWFRTPWGLCANSADAVEVMEGAEFDPDVLIPVAVAISDTTYEVMVT